MQVTEGRVRAGEASGGENLCFFQRSAQFFPLQHQPLQFLLKVGQSLWLAILLSMMLPAHLASSLSPAMWPLIPAAGREVLEVNREVEGWIEGQMRIISPHLYADA